MATQYAGRRFRPRAVEERRLPNDRGCKKQGDVIMWSNLLYIFFAQLVMFFFSLLKSGLGME